MEVEEKASDIAVGDKWKHNTKIDIQTYVDMDVEEKASDIAVGEKWKKKKAGRESDTCTIKRLRCRRC